MGVFVLVLDSWFGPVVNQSYNLYGITLVIEYESQCNNKGTHGQFGSTKFDSDALVSFKITKKIFPNIMLFGE